MSGLRSVLPDSQADRLEQLARRPLQPRRDWLLWLAAKRRELAAVAQTADIHAPADREGHEQLWFEAAA